MNPEDIVKRSAIRALQALTDDELAALNIVVQIGGDPRPIKGYTKVNHLFTEANGTLAHAVIRDAFAAEVNSRPAFQRAAHPAAGEGSAEADQQTLDAQHEARQPRDHKIWRNYTQPFPPGWPRPNPSWDTPFPAPPEQPQVKQPGNVGQPRTNESLWAEQHTDSPFMLPRRDDPKVPLPAPSIVQRAAQHFEAQYGQVIVFPPNEHAGEKHPPNEDEAHEGDTTDE